MQVYIEVQVRADGNERHLIEESDLEKDLGVYINKFKFNSHVKMAANSVIGILKRSFQILERKNLQNPVHKSAWSPYQFEEPLLC